MISGSWRYMPLRMKNFPAPDGKKDWTCRIENVFQVIKQVLQEKSFTNSEKPAHKKNVEAAEQNIRLGESLQLKTISIDKQQGASTNNEHDYFICIYHGSLQLKCWRIVIACQYIFHRWTKVHHTGQIHCTFVKFAINFKLNQKMETSTW